MLVEVPGPPPVNIRMLSKVPRERPTKSMVTASNSGRIEGNAMSATLWTSEAPFRVASSHRSIGIESRPGRSKKATKGAIRQTSIAMLVPSASRGSAIGDETSPRPSQPSAKLTIPLPVPSRKRHMTPLAIGLTSHGSSSKTRHKPLPRIGWRRTYASAKPMASSSDTAVTVKMPMLRIAAVNRGSASRAA